RLARLFLNSEVSVIAIRGLLLADVLAHLLQLKSDRGHRVTAGPEMLTGKVPLLSAQPGRWQWCSSPSETQSPRRPDAWAESGYTCAHGPGIRCPSRI